MAAIAVLASPQPAETAAPSPSPSSTPLKEIGRVGSTMYCAMLGKQIAPALQGLMKTDESISAGHRTFTKLSEDALSHSHGRLALDRSNLGQVVSIAAQNLELVQRLLNPTNFPAEPATDEDKSALELRTLLQAVATQQNAALNILSGTLETDLMGQMQSEFDTNMRSAIGKPGGTSTPGPGTNSPGPVDESQYVGVAGLPDNGPNSQFSTKNLASGTTARRTIYDSLAFEVEVQQRRIAISENAATRAVIQAVPLCTAPKTPRPTPSPAPAPLAT